MTIWFSAVVLGFVGWGLPYLLEPISVGAPIAPNPAEHPDAVVQVYGADVWGIRGRFAIHTWIATKTPNANTYTIYHVLGWRVRRGLSVVSISEGIPDRKWAGSEPILLQDIRGDKANGLIGQIDRAARLYPFADSYTMWPGPNSNSFTAWIGLMVPALNLTLPAKALGKNWMKSWFSEMQDSATANNS